MAVVCALRASVDRDHGAVVADDHIPAVHEAREGSPGATRPSFAGVRGGSGEKRLVLVEPAMMHVGD